MALDRSCDRAVQRQVQLAEWKDSWKPALPNQPGKNPLTPLLSRLRTGPCRQRARMGLQHSKKGRSATVCPVRDATPTIPPICPPARFASRRIASHRRHPWHTSLSHRRPPRRPHQRFRLSRPSTTTVSAFSKNLSLRPLPRTRRSMRRPLSVASSNTSIAGPPNRLPSAIPAIARSASRPTSWKPRSTWT